MSYLLRLVVADRPGMLGAIATALGGTGADIVSLDVVERAGGYAVDDVLIDMPAGGQPDALITAARSVPDVEVESVRPFSGSLDTHRELALVDALAAVLAAGEPGDWRALIAAETPRIFRSGWAIVLHHEDNGPSLDAASPAAPDVAGLAMPWLPLPRAVILDSGAAWVPESWARLGTALMAAPLGASGAVLVGRPGGPDFRPSELLRLTHLTGIAATVTSGGSGPAAPPPAVGIGLTLDCANPTALAEFWKFALGYVDEPPPAPFASREDWLQQFDLSDDDSDDSDDAAWLIDPSGAGPRLSLLQVGDPMIAKNRLHLDVRVLGPGERWTRVTDAVRRLAAAGATVLKEYPEHHVVLADPEGNEFCVL